MPLTGLVQTTLGARSAKTFRPNLFSNFFEVGRQGHGRSVKTEPTLSIFMVDAKAIRPVGYDETRKGLSVRRGPACGLHAPEEILVSL